jgi:hypothetical protein
VVEQLLQPQHLIEQIVEHLQEVEDKKY